MSAKHPSPLEVGGQGDRGAGHESGLDSDDDDAADIAKAAARHRLRATGGGGGKSVSPGAQSAAKRRAGSPTARWTQKPPALRGDPPIVLHDVSGLNSSSQPTPSRCCSSTRNT